MSGSMGSGADWLDVVDEHDRVTGRARRSDVHARGLLHRSVHVLLFDSTGRLFLQLRGANKDTNPGLWDTSAAGHVDAGESPDAAAARELAEELGVQLGPRALEPLFTLPPRPATGNEFVRVYRGVSDGPLTLQVDEIDGGAWLAASELRADLAADPGGAARRYTEVFRHIAQRAGLLEAD